MTHYFFDYCYKIQKNIRGIESWQERVMIPAMLKLIQEQKEQLDMQAKELNTMWKELDELKAIVEKVK